MTSLIASLSTGKGSWAHVAELIKAEDWESIFLITNTFGAQKFSVEGKQLNFVIINPDAGVKSISESIISQLDGKIVDTEVALNLISGSGKEHMAILSSVLQLGLGIRFICSSEDGCVGL